MKIAIFGGSFNPPHIGHMMACYYVLATTDIDEIWLVPSYKHPFEKEYLDFELRINMCEISVDIFKEKVKVMRFEEEICKERGEAVYSIDLLKYIREKYPGHKFFFIIGSDILLESNQWKDFDKLEEYATLIILVRKGVDPAEDYKSVLPDISSTMIRENIKRSIPVSGLVPRGVLRFIEENNLYR